MCHYITLIVAGTDGLNVKTLMRGFGREATPISNPSINAVLERGEKQFITVRAPQKCDCGTALLPSTSPSGSEDLIDVAKLKRKGWSAAKIERHRSQSAAAKTLKRQTQNRCDSVELWINILRALLEVPTTKHVGLLVHNYQGALATEQFRLERRQISEAGLEGKLRNFNEDQLVLIARN